MAEMTIAELTAILRDAKPGTPVEGLQIHDGWRAIVRSVGDGRFAVAIEDAGELWFDLVGVTEIAQRLAMSSGAVHQLRRRHAGFPKPVVVLATGPVWSWPDIEAWTAIPRRPGRPRKDRPAGGASDG